MKIAGILIILFGVVDLGGSFVDFDLWGTLGVQLPEILWQFSAYIEIAIGCGIINFFGSSDKVGEEIED